MNTFASVAWLGTFLVACGGASRGGSGDSSDAAGSSGAASSSAGAAGVGGTGAMPAMSCDEREIPSRPACTPDCKADPNDARSLECIAGDWQCQPGFVLDSSCPVESCARRYERACCDGTVGHGASAECDSQGVVQCAPGARVIAYGELCQPETVVTETCGALQGTPCSSPDFECHQGRACGGTNCTCAATRSGSLLWQCSTTPC